MRCCCCNKYSKAKVDDDPKQQPLLKEKDEVTRRDDEVITDYEPAQVSRPHRGNRKEDPKVVPIGNKSISAMLANQPSLSSFDGGIPEDITSNSQRNSIGGFSISAMLGQQSSWMKDADTEDLLDEINAEIIPEEVEEKAVLPCLYRS